MTKIIIISGSMRQGRSTPLVAKWVAQTAELVIEDKAEIAIVDLADFDLPMFDEAISPKFNRERKPEGAVKKWLDTLAAADGYIFVTPEYNHSIPGSLKNAIDYIAFETNKKAATIVSHGGVGGARATEHLRNIASEIGLVTTPVVANLIGYPGMQPVINEEGTLVDTTSEAQAKLETGLEQLLWYTEALKTARS
ncbi:MAG: NAD(P)H-dependent oxidoreductase [Candidatus Saccharimonadales bacterium]